MSPSNALCSKQLNQASVAHTIWDEIIIFEKQEWPQMSYLIHINVKIKKIDK